MTMKRLILGCAAALVLASAAAALAAPTTHSGPTRLHVLQQVTYKATHLPAGTYAIVIERHPRGATCKAYMASRREASGSELFHGSLPDGMQCVRGSRRFSAKVPAGTYRVLVRADAGKGHALAGLTVRVVK
jgi:hypothetical protein